eukprot:11778164-Alexandrium_andersonii.AAC.1
MRADASRRRTTEPTLFGSEPEELLLARRFSRAQGDRPDGAVELRAVEDYAGCGVNNACCARGKLRC